MTRDPDSFVEAVLEEAHRAAAQPTRRGSMWNICEPPGFSRFYELHWRDRYRRERSATVETDTGATWPVDLGEAGS